MHKNVYLLLFIYKFVLGCFDCSEMIATTLFVLLDGLVNVVTSISRSEIGAMAGAINTTNTILDLGSYNQATATLMYCMILFLYHPVGGEAQNCSKCQNSSIIDPN